MSRKTWSEPEAKSALENQAAKYHHGVLTWDGLTATCPKCHREGKAVLEPELRRKARHHSDEERYPPFCLPITYEYCTDLQIANHRAKFGYGALPEKDADGNPFP